MLLVYGCDQLCLQWATTFANANQAGLANWQDLSAIVHRFNITNSSEKRFDIGQFTVKNQREELEYLANVLKPWTSNTPTRVVEEKLTEEIIADLWKNHRDLLILPQSESAHFAKSLRKFWGNAPTSVLFVNPDLPQVKRKVLAVLDRHDEVSASTIRDCKRFNAAEDGEVLFVHTWTQKGSEYFEGRRGIATRVLREVTEEETSVRTQSLQRLLAQHGFENGNLVVRRGDKFKVVPEIVARDSVDLVILEPQESTRSFFGFYRNPLDKMIGIANCSVLVTAPPRFVERASE